MSTLNIAEIKAELPKILKYSSNVKTVTELKATDNEVTFAVEYTTKVTAIVTVNPTQITVNWSEELKCSSTSAVINMLYTCGFTPPPVPYEPR